MKRNENPVEKEVKFTIRNARSEDVEGITRVHFEAWQKAYRGQLSDKLLDSLTFEEFLERNKDRSKNPEAEIIVAVGEENKIVGFCAAGKSREKDHGEEGEIYAIYVHPDETSSGIGTALMEEAISRLKRKDFKHATLRVLETNTKVHKFYEKIGWTKTNQKIDVREYKGEKLPEIMYEYDLIND